MKTLITILLIVIPQLFQAQTHQKEDEENRGIIQI